MIARNFFSKLTHLIHSQTYSTNALVLRSSW